MSEFAEFGLLLGTKLFSLHTPRLRAEFSVAMPALQIIFDKSLGGGIERITTDGQKLPERRERSAPSQSSAPARRTDRGLKTLNGREGCADYRTDNAESV